MRDRLFVHVAWATRERRPLIDAATAHYLTENLPIIARQERARILEAGLVTTHAHLLVRLHPTTNIPRLLQRMKGGSAMVANRDGHAARTLRWAKGYSIDSVSARALERVRAYVRAQAEHHPGQAIAGWDPRVDPPLG